MDKEREILHWETYEQLGSSLELGTECVHKTLSEMDIHSGMIGVEQGWELVLGSTLRYEMNVVGERTVNMLRRKLPSFKLRDTSRLLVLARSIKTEVEVETLRKVNQIARVGLVTFHDSLTPGLSEVELSTKIEKQIVTEGILKHKAGRITACAFLASGRDTAYAYKYVPGKARRKLRRGDLVMLELDVVVDGYSSDTTRTFVVGKPNKRQKALLEAVLESETAAISSIKPGIRASEIAKVSVEVIRRHGLSSYLVHRLGHGVGVGMHEPIPALHVESKHVLLPGMVHSVEPGIYGPRIGGVRIEDDVLDTRKGAEYLSDYLRLQQ
jgi:Xaa-Pro dipeptidase